MLPPDSVVVAARRWLRLLRTSSLDQASALIQSSAAYTDLSATQYGSALDWLRGLGMVARTDSGLALTTEALTLPDSEVGELLFSRGLESDMPSWLPDADLLVTTPGDLPEDAASMADALGIANGTAMRLVRQAHRRVDLELRAAVGLAGELAVLSMLDARWPGSCVHVALQSDAFGYDVVFSAASQSLHLEVKTTTRHGRLVIYLSRHEFEVSRADQNWHLVIVGLDATKSDASAIATVASELIAERVPQDIHRGTTWESVSLEFAPGDLQPGLPFLASIPGSRLADDLLLKRGSCEATSGYAWLPAG